MRKPIIFFLIMSLVAAQGCHETKPSAAEQAANRDKLLAPPPPTPTADKGYDKSPAANSNVGSVPTVLSTIGAVLVAPFVYVGEQWELAQGHTPAHAVQQMNDKSNADQRRLGIIDLVTEWDFARKPPYTTKYKMMAQNDPDFTVRAMAIRALNICRDSSATPIFVTALDDENELIRLEAAKALANIPDPAAIPGLESLLTGRRESITPDGQQVFTAESLDVRIAAADALRNYRQVDVARNLIVYLKPEENFAVVWQSHHSLTILTGRDLQYDQSAWFAYLAGPDRPLR